MIKHIRWSKVAGESREFLCISLKYCARTLDEGCGRPGLCMLMRDAVVVQSSEVAMAGKPH
jgi:hypothetical protein